MPVFNYKARTKGGDVLRDQTEGESVASVAASLRHQGLLVIEVEERGVGDRDVLEPFRRVGADDLAVFTRQFAAMIDAGLPIVRALGVLAEQTENEKLRGVVSEVRRDVESGEPLSDALGRHPEVFGRLYVEMVRAGEVGGVLDEVLLRIAAQQEKDRELRRKVRSALTYPLVVLVMAVLAAAFMLVFVVPIFARMFEDLGGTLPLPTQIAMALSGLLTGFGGLVLLILLVAAAYAFYRWRKTEQGRRVWDRLVLRLPLRVGEVARKVAVARFARTFGTLSSSGVPILQALEITASAAGNHEVERAVLGARDAVRRGSAIHEPLEAEPVFPPMVSRMVAVGEETGDLEGMLEKVADFYEGEVDAAVGSLASIIEPVMIVVVGAIVGGIIVAMYLPMFRIFELIE